MKDEDKKMPVGMTGGNRRVRQVNPVGMRILVQIHQEENTTEAGLYLPEGAKESKQDTLFCRVIEVASAVDIDTDEEANISGIPLGADVLIPYVAGKRVPWDDSIRIVDTKDVLAIVSENEVI